MNPRFSRTFGLLAMVLAVLTTLVPSAAFAAPQVQEVTCAQEYMVQAGDSLGKIADKYLGDSAAYPAIVEATSQKQAVDATFAEITDPNVIQIGWKLCVPQARIIAAAQAGELVVEAGTYEIQGKPYVADIGTLTVPENRSNPDSRLMELPVVRIHATGENPVEPVFLLAGGPGGPNMWGDGVPVWLLDHHDVVMVGYRGVDGSVYLDAPEVVEVIGEVEQYPLSSENLERMGNAQYAANQRLRAEGVDIDGYNMVEVIDDMEAAREGLGYGKINLFSGSYGTRLAYIYGLRHPESLFRSLLFAVNPPGRMVWEPDRIDAQLRYYGDLWKKDPEAVAKSPDIIRTMQNVLETLPQEWNGIRVDPDMVKMMAFIQLMNTGTAAAVFDAFVAAENGDYSGLAFMSFAYSQMLPTMLHWGDLFSKGMADHDPLRDYEADMDPPGSIIGSPGSKLYFGGAPHGGWPMQPIGEEYRQLGYSDVETLLVSGSVDFSTPAENAQELLPYLPNGKSVVLSEMGHTGDQRGLQPEAFQHLTETFYLEGVVDDSKFTYQPMNFTPSQTFQDMAKAYMEQATAAEQPLDVQLQAALEAAVESPDTLFPGAALYVSSPELGTWSGAAGLGDIETTTAMRPEDKFRAGSIMKPFVAVVVLQLVEEGLLSLDDPLPAVLPESVTARFADSDQITVRMLLNHTSGILDWLTEAAIAEIVANPTKVWDMEEFLDLAAAQEPAFAPGEDYTYSNTEYNLLGLIIERATGRSWRDEVRGRVIEPLNLQNTHLPEPGDLSIPGDYAHGYHPIEGTLVDFTEVDPSMAGAAGGSALVSNLPDLVRFMGALLAGDLFQNAETLDEMLAFVDAPDEGGQVGYGLGIEQRMLPGGIEMIGHLGGTAGYRTYTGYLPAQDISIAMVVNVEGDPTPVLFPALQILIPQAAVQEQPAPAGNVYEDPEGRFTLPLVGNWTQVETDEADALFEVPGLDLNMYVVTVESDDLAAGAEAALRQIGIDPSALTKTNETKLGDWYLTFYSLREGKGVTPLCQVEDKVTYCLVATGDEGLTKNPPEHVMKTMQGFAIAGKEIVLPTTVEEFEAYINSFVGDIPPGLSIVITLDGEVLYANGFGLADGPQGMPAKPDTVYQWGSMTKMATATALMQLVDQGLVDLDAPISDYLDYVPAEYGITVRHLFTHSAGLNEPSDFILGNLRLDGQPLPDPDLFARGYFEDFSGPMFEPGSASSYSSPGIVLLGQIVAEVSGQPYIEYVQEHILAPLGMENTDCTYSNEAMIANAAAPAFPAGQVEDVIVMVDGVRGLGDGADFIREVDERFAWMNLYNVFGAGGCLIGPATEVMRFAQMHLNGGELDGVRLLSPEAVAQMQEMQYSTQGDPFGWGLGWIVADEGEHPYVEHDGGGVGLWDKVRLYPEEGLAIVLMSNASGWDRVRVADAAASVVFSMPAG